MTRRFIKQKAVEISIKTGHMPNVDLIWAFQAQEGNQACFGYGQDCSRQDCRWYNPCNSLAQAIG